MDQCSFTLTVSTDNVSFECSQTVRITSHQREADGESVTSWSSLLLQKSTSKDVR